MEKNILSMGKVFHQQTLNISCEDKSSEPASISVQRQSVNLLDLLSQLSFYVFLSLPNVHR